MIVEGVVTSTDSDGTLNVAPMGPIVQGNYDALVLRPFQSSTTFRNLQQTRCGVFHVVDTVDLIARSAIGRPDIQPVTRSAEHIKGRILCDCCRWFEFQVTAIDDSEARSVLQAEIVSRGEQRPFFGFNRARHAVLEAAILATRVHLLPADEIMTQMTVLAAAVRKTGAAPEQAAFDLLLQHVEQACGQPS